MKLLLTSSLLLAIAAPAVKAQVPAIDENAYWQVTNVDGAECVIDGPCIKSHPGAGETDYMNYEDCNFVAKKDGTLHPEFFNTENRYDYVAISGTQFTGSEVGGYGNPFVLPLEVTGGTTGIWNTDDSVTDLGFEICYRVSGGSQGDPHFKLWSGEWFDFHGICDQVLTSAPSFGNGLGLEIHIRTKPRYQYSYIEATAIKIGDDVLEIGSWGEYWFNGVDDVELPISLAGKYTVEKIIDSQKQHKFIVTLDKQKEEHIAVNVFKDMVSVSVEHATMDSFGASSGLLGSFPEGVMLARDGAAVMEDHDMYGQEWQVTPLDPQIFQSTNKNQYAVGVCAPPVSTETRRLGEGIAMEAAEKACAHHTDDKMKQMCIFDVMAMGDLEMAEINGAF